MLPRHAVYRKLDAPVTFLGVELEDWFGLGVAFVVLSRVSDLLVGQALGWPRAEAGVSACATGLVFAAWRGVRERAPRHFLRHFLEFVGEPASYELVADRDVNPYVG
ncbi:MAG TPA: hypothetical protein VFL28_15630 [bacterium]|nr:hypothetical protein [bacterium]